MWISVPRFFSEIKTITSPEKSQNDMIQKSKTVIRTAICTVIRIFYFNLTSRGQTSEKKTLRTAITLDFCVKNSLLRHPVTETVIR